MHFDGSLFARVYNTKWAHFANQVAPRILDFYARTDAGRLNKSVLDLCCGTGQLALYFLNRGYKVIGIDLSESMLHIAKGSAGRHLETGQAEFRLGNATDFSLEGPVGLVTSTFDSLNHLDGDEALRACFRSVFSVLVSGGYFIFDLNTRAGLKRWNNIFVDESTDEAMLISLGFYDGQGDKAYTKVSGFVRTPDGLYDRFEETVFNTVFEMSMVKGALLEAGWRKVHFARTEDLTLFREKRSTAKTPRPPRRLGFCL